MAYSDVRIILLERFEGRSEWNRERLVIRK